MSTFVHRQMCRARSEEGGWALVTAILLMAIMMSTGVALAGYVDTETRQSGVSRTRETAFNLAEAALNAQVFALAAEWPGAGFSNPASTQRTVWGPGVSRGNQYGLCTEANTAVGDVRCPNVAQLRGLFPTPDADPDATWQTTVIDNASPYQAYYSDAALAGAVGYDANGDDRLWVRSRATVKGRTRTLVSLVRAEKQQEDVVHAAVLAGSISIGNSGNKVMIEGGGGIIGVRCDWLANQSATCLGRPYSSSQFSKNDVQISPGGVANVKKNWPDSKAMSDDALERLRVTARSAGTWFADCSTMGGRPPVAPLVFVEGGACDFSVNPNEEINSPAAPGLFVNVTGTIGWRHGTFHGVLYAANRDPLNPTLTVDDGHVAVDIDANGVVSGGVLVDGLARADISSSKLNLQFADSAFGSFRSVATAGIVQNTWRELNAGS
jgi:hypothetical protein